MNAVSPDDVDALQREIDDRGYAVLREVVSKDRLAEFCTALLDEYDRAEKFTGGGSFSGHLNCFPGERSRFIYEEIEAAGIVDAVRAMRPDQSNRVRATLNFNLPNSVPQHYHMDGLYIEDFMICNIAVVDTDLFNGAIDLLPGTNQQFLKFWQYATQRKYKSTTRIPMLRGDVLLRKSTLWHRGMPNKSTTPRPMMSLTFGERSAPEGDPFTVNDGKMEFYPNWFNTSRLGQVREKVFVKAPLTYSGYRFVKSLHGDHGYAKY